MGADVNAEQGSALPPSPPKQPPRLPGASNPARVEQRWPPTAGTPPVGAEISLELSEVLHKPTPTSPSAEAGAEYLSLIRGTV